MFSWGRVPKKYLAVAAGFTLSFAGGFFVARLIGSAVPPAGAVALREQVNNYTYINPLLACLQSENVAYEELNFLKKEIERVTDRAKKDGRVEAASVYFRDLTRGRWVGMNEMETYSPASLLKVPVAIAYLKQAETKPASLEQAFDYRKTRGNDSSLLTESLLVSGRTYTAAELIQGMIVDSDNDAKDLLVGALDPDFLNEIYFDLGIKSPYARTPQESDYQISTKTYALFFRILYNATLLNHEMSEKTLKLLSEAKFPKGLKASIPGDVPIAHKYGVRLTEEDGSRTIELSDCGIVYEKTNPYLICIMAKGRDPEMLASYIQSVGSVAYKEVQGALGD